MMEPDKTFRIMGNESFVKRKFEDAIRYYSKAIEIEMDHKLLSNRSACYLAIGDPFHALQDADSCISLSPSWGKGFGRKGSSLMELQRFQSAINAYEEAIRNGWDNVNIRAALESAKQQLKTKLSSFSALDSALDLANADYNDKTDAPLIDLMKQIEGGNSKIDRVSHERRVTDEEIENSTSKEQITRLIGAGNSKWRNLNPFYVLMLPPNATIEDIKQRYRKLSTLIHPDKCPDTEARNAFEIVKDAFMVLQDKLKRENSAKLMLGARRVVQKEWKKFESKGVKLDGDFEDAVRKEILKVFAQAEQKRLRSKKTQVAYKKREREAEIEQEKQMRKDQRAAKEWAEGTETRVGGWRDFIGDKSSNKKQKKMPSLKTEARGHGGHHDKAGTSYKKTWR